MKTFGSDSRERERALHSLAEKEVANCARSALHTKKRIARSHLDCLWSRWRASRESRASGTSAPSRVRKVRAPSARATKMCAKKKTALSSAAKMEARKSGSNCSHFIHLDCLMCLWLRLRSARAALFATGRLPRAATLKRSLRHSKQPKLEEELAEALERRLTTMFLVSVLSAQRGGASGASGD